jgi:hypothetical protein
MMYHIFLKFKYFLEHFKYFLNLNMMYHVFLYIFSLLFLNIFYNIKKCCTMHIFKHFKCFKLQIFSNFKYDVLHISIYFLSHISKFRENITYFYIFSLSYLDLELINPINTPYISSKQKTTSNKSKNI